MTQTLRDTKGETIEQIIAALEARGYKVTVYRRGHDKHDARRVWFVRLTIN
jgi:hypothetical protein